jgi:hypothetical protein
MDVFHGSGKTPVSNDKVKILSSKREVSTPPFLMTMGGIPSGPGAVVGFTELTSVFISLRLGTMFDRVQSGMISEPTSREPSELWL